jgi:carbamoyltransferase
LCHAYHAYFTSPCKDAVILVIDGYGDEFSSYSVYKAEGQNIKQIFRNKTRISLGDFYGELTLLCGFDAVGGEQWKVMGMAPYGKKCEALYADFEKWIYTDGIELKTRSTQFHIEFRKQIKEKAYGELSREDLAFTGQLFYEEIVKQLINAIYLKWPHANLVFAGGCALNSAANGKIHVETPYKNVYIPSAPADDGCAIGAALLSFKKQNPKKSIPYNQHNPYLGFDIKEEEILFFAKYSGYSYKKSAYADLYTEVAKEIQSGKIIAWVQGRAEFGPRSLGNRSILANPSLADMKDKINANVKFREEFRPFAPSVLEEKANEYFENYHPTPYMERVLTIKENKRAELKAVNHIDNTGRLQTVSKKSNEHFYNLINEFYKLTNVPVLLNTSFNVMGKPIVNSVSDMAAVFATSGIDVLAINNYIFRKKSSF